MTNAPRRTRNIVEETIFPPGQTRPQPRVNALEAAILDAQRQRRHGPPQRRTARSVIWRIVATIRKERL